MNIETPLFSHHKKNLSQKHIFVSQNTELSTECPPNIKTEYKNFNQVNINHKDNARSFTNYDNYRSPSKPLSPLSKDRSNGN